MAGCSAPAVGSEIYGLMRVNRDRPEYFLLGALRVPSKEKSRCPQGVSGSRLYNQLSLQSALLSDTSL